MQGNELLIPGVSDAHARLPENCQKEALSLRLMRQETINGKGFSLQQVTRYIPLFRNIERKHFCTEFIPYPTDVFFIFLCVISTSAIYQYEQAIAYLRKEAVTLSDADSSGR